MLRRGRDGRLDQRRPDLLLLSVGLRGERAEDQHVDQPVGRIDPAAGQLHTADEVAAVLGDEGGSGVARCFEGLDQAPDVWSAECLLDDGTH